MLPVRGKSAAVPGHNVAATSFVVHKMFQIGETVVHPQHGVGQIVRLEDREFDPGNQQRYYEISIPGGGTVWVPVDLPNSGLRKLATKRDMIRCRHILESRPSRLSQDGHVRQSELVARLRQGTIFAQCEMVRDLHTYGSQKSFIGMIWGFAEATHKVLCQEWAMIEEITLVDATSEINSLLEKSKKSLGDKKK